MLISIKMPRKYENIYSFLSMFGSWQANICSCRWQACCIGVWNNCGLQVQWTEIASVGEVAGVYSKQAYEVLASEGAVKVYAVSGAATPGFTPSELGCLILFEAFVFSYGYERVFSMVFWFEVLCYCFWGDITLLLTLCLLSFFSVEVNTLNFSGAEDRFSLHFGSCS